MKCSKNICIVLAIVFMEMSMLQAHGIYSKGGLSFITDILSKKCRKRGGQYAIAGSWANVNIELKHRKAETDKKKGAQQCAGEEGTEKGKWDVERGTWEEAERAAGIMKDKRDTWIWEGERGGGWGGVDFLAMNICFMLSNITLNSFAAIIVCLTNAEIFLTTELLSLLYWKTWYSTYISYQPHNMSLIASRYLFG